MIAPALLFGLAACGATLLGGTAALRLGERTVPFLGASAGIVIGLALFDLLPESLALAGPGRSARGLMIWLAGGFGAYLLLDRAFGRSDRLPQHWRAHLAPATLTAHSLLDGLVIGFAFQIDEGAGWLVAIAVLAHDLTDGANTVGLCFAAEAGHAARGWLLLDSAAPLAGVLLGLGITLPHALLAPLLAAFAGGFLHLGACELLPRSHRRDPRLRTTVASLAGMLLILALTTLAR